MVQRSRVFSGWSKAISDSGGNALYYVKLSGYCCFILALNIQHNRLRYFCQNTANGLYYTKEA